jgi:transcriptional regulator with XRE-family HTH domain
VKNPAGVKAFGLHLRALREAKQFSLQQIADTANLDKSTVHRIELGIASPRLDALISLSRALGISIKDLMDNPAITDSDDGM